MNNDDDPHAVAEQIARDLRNDAGRLQDLDTLRAYDLADLAHEAPPVNRAIGEPANVARSRAARAWYRKDDLRGRKERKARRQAQRAARKRQR